MYVSDPKHPFSDDRKRPEAVIEYLHLILVQWHGCPSYSKKVSDDPSSIAQARLGV